MKIRNIMTNPAIVANEHISVESAAKIMREHNIGSVPVVSDDGNIIGIVTDRDMVIRAGARGLGPKRHSVSEIMTGHVTTVAPDTAICTAAKIMADDKIRRLPVVDNNTVVGFVALGDVARRSDFSVETADALCEISEGCHKKHPCHNNEK